MWISRGGRSDDEPPTREQLHEWHRRMSPPDNEFPAGVGITTLLGRTSDAAVGITQFEAFSTGFRFSLAVRLRTVRPDLTGGRLFMLIGSHGHPGMDIPLEERLLLGLEYPDGLRASTLQDRLPFGPAGMPAADELVLTQQGGGGDEQSVDQTFWVAPLPPAGPVTFVLSWPAFGLQESRTVVDGAAIRAAAERSQRLWEPQPPMEPPTPQPPPRPSSGWFADPPS